MQGLTEDGRRIVEDVANRHGVSTDAVYSLLLALVAGGGRQAQFSHPDLGGMGQWSQGGMIMVGDMFNNGLKYRVDALCNELAAIVQNDAPFAAAPMSSQSQSQSSGMGGISSVSLMGGRGGGVSLFVPGALGGASRWPAELGTPSSVGSQNDLHYAVFPATRRLAIEQGGRLTIYDIGDHQISGFSQQQSGDQSLTFTSQHGLVRVADLKLVSPGVAAAPAAPPSAEPPVAPLFDPAPPPAYAAPTTSGLAPGASDDEIFTRIERLAELRKKDIITAEEFDAKKAELLARL
jgi:hypothetical protein